jgi:hypothetical protein
MSLHEVLNVQFEVKMCYQMLSLPWKPHYLYSLQSILSCFTPTLLKYLNSFALNIYAYKNSQYKKYLKS